MLLFTPLLTSSCPSRCTPQELSMPALSPTMSQGNLVAWHVKEGQAVAPGDVLADVETDKATLRWACWAFAVHAVCRC